MSNTVTLYRATSTPGTRNSGDCWTTELSIAESYIEGQTSSSVETMDIDLDKLMHVEVAAYDRNENYAIGDDAGDLDTYAAQGIDVITYDDEDMRGEAHRTYRFIK